MSFCSRTTRELGHDGLRNRDPEHLDLVGLREARIDVAQRLERADHQARGDQEHERERDLRDDERIARAMTFPAQPVRPPRCRSTSSRREPRILE